MVKDKQGIALWRFLNREIMSWNSIFAYRNLWMFAAMVCIILYHAPYTPFSGRLLTEIRIYGYGGVDIFLFASGIGCWFSLRKDGDILHFLKRRFWRIMPVFMMSLVAWAVYKYLVSSITLPQIIGNIFGHGTLAGQGNQLNWYFACLWVCYFASPFFAALVQEHTSVLPRGLITVLLVIFSFPFFDRLSLMLWSRIPVYFLGMCVAQTASAKKSLSLGAFFLSLSGAAAGMMVLKWLVGHNEDLLWTYGGWWYPFILIAPGACFVISAAAVLIEKTPLWPILRLCSKSGEYTLSLSLTHVIIFDLYRHLVSMSIIAYNWITFCGAILLTVISSVCMERAGKCFLSR